MNKPITRTFIASILLGLVITKWFIFLFAWMHGQETGLYQVTVYINLFGEAFIETFIMFPLIIGAGFWLVRDLFKTETNLNNIPNNIKR